MTPHFTSHHSINPKRQSSPDGGFTIVETLVAITILMIAIAGPMTVAHRGLTSAVHAKDQMVASFLAQDAMEYIKNAKDNDVWSPTSGWLDTIGSCTEGNSCIIDTPSDGMTNFGNADAPGPVCMDNDGDYYQPASPSCVSGDIKTVYQRAFYIEETGTSNERKAVVKVVWESGAIPYEIMLESFIYNTTLSN